MEPNPPIVEQSKLLNPEDPKSLKPQGQLASSPPSTSTTKPSSDEEQIQSTTKPTSCFEEVKGGGEEEELIASDSDDNHDWEEHPEAKKELEGAEDGGSEGAVSLEDEKDMEVDDVDLIAYEKYKQDQECPLQLKDD